jgi:hypothetical protein
MDENRPDRRKVGSWTLTALLGLFVVAILLALASRLLPGRLSGLARRALRGGEDAKPPLD